MSALGNVIWFVFGGAILALFWLIIAAAFAITVIGLPIARACLEFAKLSAFPFGKEIIRDTELKGTNNVSDLAKIVNIVLNIVWFPIGLFLTVVYLVYGIISFITIIGIPTGIVYVRMGKFLLFPVGARVVSKKQAYASAVANELEKRGVVGKGITESPQYIAVNNESDTTISSGKENILADLNLDWREILTENNFGEHIEIFEKNKLVNVAAISELTELDLEKLGFTIMGDRKNIKKLFSVESLQQMSFEKEQLVKDEIANESLRQMGGEKEQAVKDEVKTELTVAGKKNKRLLIGIGVIAVLAIGFSFYFFSTRIKVDDNAVAVATENIEETVDSVEAGQVDVQDFGINSGTYIYDMSFGDYHVNYIAFSSNNQIELWNEWAPGQRSNQIFGTYYVTNTDGLDFITITWSTGERDRYLYLTNNDLQALYLYSVDSVNSLPHFSGNTTSRRERTDGRSIVHGHDYVPGLHEGDPWITASSSFSETISGRTVVYTPDNLGIGIGECWVPNNGIGDTLTLSINPRNQIGENIYISSGFVSMARSHLYRENARIKTMRVSDNFGNSRIAELRDTPHFQPISISGVGNLRGTSVITLEILDVYPGTRYSDICVNSLAYIKLDL